MNSLLVTAALACLTVSAARAPHARSPLWQDTPAPSASNCRIDGELVPNADLPEGSGVAASRRLPGVLWADLLAGRWREAFRADLRSLKEPRGEGLALGRSGMVFLVGEGGPLSRAGTFARLTCSVQP